MEFGIERYAMLIMKRRKGEMREGIELPDQERVRTLREKENYKNLGKLEADNMKLVKMKEKKKKKKKNGVDERENFSKLQTAEILSKE